MSIVDDHYLPLHGACQRDDVAKVGRLLYHRHGGVNINETDTHRRTPLIIASRRGCVPIVFQLLDYGGANLDVKDIMGKTALIYAAETNAHVIALHLLARNADPNICDGTGATPLVIASKYGHGTIVRQLIGNSRTWIDHQDKYGATALWYAAFNGDEKILELLLEHHARPFIADVHQKTPLIIATELGHVECVALLLKDMRSNIEATDKEGKTALRHACENNFVDIVKLLVQHEAQANARSVIDSMTILMAASEMGHKKVVKYLLENTDVDLCATDYADRTALYCACKHEAIAHMLVDHGAPLHNVDRGGKTILMRAAQVGNASIIARILQRASDAPGLDLIDQDGFTAFAYACVAGHADVAKLLLKAGASPTIADDDDITPLMLASMNGHADVVAFLAALTSPDPGINYRDYRGMTALAKACFRGHVNVVKTLLGHGASPTISDKQHVTPLMKACDNNYPEVVAALLDATTANINAVSKRHETALYYASKEEAVECVEILLERNADPTIPNAAGITPLMLACISGNLDIARALFSRLRSSDLDAQDVQGYTALFHASDGNHTDLVIALLQRGADPTICSMTLTTPLMLASSRGNDDIVTELLKGAARYRINDVDAENMTALFHAAAQGLGETVGILLQHNANPSLRTETEATPLLVAAEHGYMDVVKRLVECWPTPQAKQQYINLPNERGLTPLHQATAFGYADVVSFLLDHGADVDATDEYGNTPLIMAASRKQLACAKLLLQKIGPTSVNATNVQGKSPLYFAIFHHLLDMAQLLRQHGADIQLLLRNGTLWNTGYPQYASLRMIRELVDNFGVDVNVKNREGKTTLFLLAHAFGNKHDRIAFLLARGANPWIAGPSGLLPISGSTNVRVHDLLQNAMVEHERFRTLEKARALHHIHSRFEYLSISEKTRAAKRRKCLAEASNVMKDRLETFKPLPRVSCNQASTDDTLTGVVCHLMGNEVNDDVFRELFDMMRVPWD